jgi:hypothetical protein
MNKTKEKLPMLLQFIQKATMRIFSHFFIMEVSDHSSLTPFQHVTLTALEFTLKINISKAFQRTKSTQ